MNPGDVWNFPLEGGRGEALLRVMLRSRDIRPSSNNLLAFLGDSILVQISTRTPFSEATFEKANVLIDGLLLSEVRSKLPSGYRKVGELPVQIDQVEFPCWFAKDSSQGLVFCRGEIIYPVGGVDFEHIEQHWRALLTLCLPNQLGWFVSQFLDYQERVSRGGRLEKFDRIPQSDLRYHPNRDEALERIGVSISHPYYLALADMLGEEKLSVYKAAITRQ